LGAIAIYSSGMVTGVGLNAPASCAAIRVGITGFVETRFMFAGEWLQGCPVPLAEEWRGVEKLRRMVVTAIEECMAGSAPLTLDRCPLLLCVAEKDRPGRFAGLDDSFLRAVAEDLEQVLHPDSRLFAAGRIGGVQALDYARQLIADGAPGCVVAGSDTYLVAGTLTANNEKRRLVTEENSNGFIPGEAAAAITVGPVRRQEESQLLCLGIGFGEEPAPWYSDEPLRADGLVQAIKAAFADGRCSYADVEFRLTDNNGEAFGFKDSALAMTRTLRDRKEEFDIWHPVDCVGEVGAAVVPLLLGVMQSATTKGYAPGPGALCHVSGDGTERAAFVLRHRNWSDD
jgi:3-oxoacyl-[acyl-carrier-protein] synthase-1